MCALCFFAAEMTRLLAVKTYQDAMLAMATREKDKIIAKAKQFKCTYELSAKGSGKVPFFLLAWLNWQLAVTMPNTHVFPDFTYQVSVEFYIEVWRLFCASFAHRCLHRRTTDAFQSTSFFRIWLMQKVRLHLSFVCTPDLSIRILQFLKELKIRPLETTCKRERSHSILKLPVGSRRCDQ